MKKALIIGAKGMLGQELAKVFRADKNYQVSIWDLEDIDITYEPQIKVKILKLAPEIIINAAAYNAVDKCEEPAEFEIARKINGLAPGYLAQAAKKLDAVFIHFSTDYVFDGRKKEGYQEDDKPSPISRYGRSKLLGEKKVQEAGGKFYLIRLQKLFGLPAKSAAAKKSFFETMLVLAKTKKEMQIVDEELANFTYAPDLAVRTKYLIENGLPCGIYHITNEGRPVTWYGAVKILFELTGKKDIRMIPVPAEKFPRPAKRPKYTVLLNTKLPPLRPWPEALKEFLKISA